MPDGQPAEPRSRYLVGSVDEVPVGGSKMVPYGKFGIGVYNIDGEFFAIANYCPHRGGPVCAGVRVPQYVAKRPYEIETVRHGEFLRCPWHGWDYDIKTGEAAVENKRLRSHRVTVEDGQIYLEDV